MENPEQPSRSPEFCDNIDKFEEFLMTGREAEIFDHAKECRCCKVMVLEMELVSTGCSDWPLGFLVFQYLDILAYGDAYVEGWEPLILNPTEEISRLQKHTRDCIGCSGLLARTRRFDPPTPEELRRMLPPEIQEKLNKQTRIEEEGEDTE